jgi:hypothetical protein
MTCCARGHTEPAFTGKDVHARTTAPTAAPAAGMRCSVRMPSSHPPNAVGNRQSALGVSPGWMPAQGTASYPDPRSQLGPMAMMLVRLGTRAGLSSARFGVGPGDRDPGRHPRGTVRVPARRRDGHRCLQRDVGVLAAHRAAVDEPAAIWLVLGYGYAWPAGLKLRRESAAIAGWPDHDASVARPPPKGAQLAGVTIATRKGRPSEANRWGGRALG